MPLIRHSDERITCRNWRHNLCIDWTWV